MNISLYSSQKGTSCRFCPCGQFVRMECFEVFFRRGHVLRDTTGNYNWCLLFSIVLSCLQFLPFLFLYIFEVNILRLFHFANLISFPQLLFLLETFCFVFSAQVPNRLGFGSRVWRLRVFRHRKARDFLITLNNLNVSFTQIFLFNNPICITNVLFVNKYVCI